MCRLLGVIANKPVDIDYSYSHFQKLSQGNPDGWGIGWYKKGIPFFEKKPVRADTDSYNKKIKSKIFLSHLRFATEGDLHRNNCHPFMEVPWLFAHNGGINRRKLLEMVDSAWKDESKIKGETDSEVFFYWLLQNISNNKDNVISGIKEALLKSEDVDHFSRNFILTDGKTVYAYRDYYSLCYVERDPENLADAFSDDISDLLKSKSLNHEKAVIICSQELGDEKWKHLKERELLVVSGDLKVNKHQL